MSVMERITIAMDHGTVEYEIDSDNWTFDVDREVAVGPDGARVAASSGELRVSGRYLSSKYTPRETPA